MDKPKSYAAFELGNTQMSGWIDNFLRRRGEFMFEFPKPGPPGPPPPISPNNKIIVLMSPTYPIGYDLIKYIINLGLVTSNVETYLQKNGEDIVTLVNNYYNKGYRFFIGTQNSKELTSLTSFFIEQTDCCYFNTYSTIFNLQMPTNMIRSVVNDYTLTQYINNYFVLNVDNLLGISKNMLMYTPLSLTPTDEPAFKHFVYIYEASSYTEEFLNMLQQTNDPNLNITIETFLIGETEPLPDLLIELLIANPVSGVDYQTSNKTLFFLNSSNPQNLLNKITNELWYDNYFFFCDPFFDDLLKTSYPFYYSFLGAGCFSSIGYKLSQQIDPNQDISPTALAVVNLIIQLGQWYLNNAKPETTMPELLYTLKSIQYLNQGNDDNWYWYEKQIYIYNSAYNHTGTQSDGYPIHKNPLLVSASASPTTNGGLSPTIPWSSVTYGTINGNGLYVAVSSDGKVGTSSDGIIWTLGTCPNRTWQSVTYGKGIFVAVASSGTDTNGVSTRQLVMRSLNGIVWTIQNAINIASWSSVIYGNNTFVAVANSGSVTATVCNLMYSIDGVSWLANCNSTKRINWNSVTFGIIGNVSTSTNTRFACVSNNQSAYLSLNLMTSNSGYSPWGRPSTISVTPCKAISWGSPNGVGLFLFIETPSFETSNPNNIWTSTDTVTWVSRTLPKPSTSIYGYVWQSIAFGNTANFPAGLFVAVSSDGKVMTSPNGSTWTLGTCPNYTWKSVTFGTPNGNPLFVAVANGGLANAAIMSSPDGIIWTTPLVG